MNDSCIWCGNPNFVIATPNGSICQFCLDNHHRERDCPWCHNDLCWDLSTLCKNHFNALMEVHGQTEAFRKATA